MTSEQQIRKLIRLHPKVNETVKLFCAQCQQNGWAITEQVVFSEGAKLFMAKVRRDVRAGRLKPDFFTGYSKKSPKLQKPKPCKK